jgi:hypothetical protein
MMILCNPRISRRHYKAVTSRLQPGKFGERQPGYRQKRYPASDRIEPECILVNSVSAYKEDNRFMAGAKCAVTEQLS